MTLSRSDLLEHPFRSQTHIVGLTHGLYRYPARFSPALVAAALKAFSAPGDTVLDPFVGGGTSAIESLARGRRFVGFDINPLAVLLTQVKTDPLDDRTLRVLEHWLGAAHANPAVNHEDGRLRNAPEELVQKLAPYVASIDALPGSRAQMAARAVLMDVAQWAIDGRQTSAPADALVGALTGSLARLRMGTAELVDLGKLNGVRRSDFARRRVLRLGSAQHVAQSRPLNRLVGRAKLVVTSPPYPGVHVLYHRWQVRGRSETPMAYWIANASDGLGPKHYTMGGRSMIGETTYFSEIRETWAAIRRLLRPDALVLQLVAFTDADAQLPRYLETMSEAGYLHRPDLEPDGWRDVPNRRWYYRVRPERGGAQERIIMHEPNISGLPQTSRRGEVSRSTTR